MTSPKEFKEPLLSRIARGEKVVCPACGKGEIKQIGEAVFKCTNCDVTIVATISMDDD